VQVRLPERASGQSVPLADAPGIWTTSRHMRFLRVALAAVLLGLLVSLLVSSLRLKTRPTSYFAKGGGGLAVIDFSKSIDPRSYRRMSMILRTLADSNQRLGLIAFSDDAYMMLPPGTRGDEVRPMLRFFGGKSFTSLASIQTPWSTAFLGGPDRQRAEGGKARVRARGCQERLGAPDLRPRRLEHGHPERDGGADDVPPRGAPAPNRAALPHPGESGVLLGARGSVLSSHELLDNSKVAERQSVVGSFPKWLFFGGAFLLLGVALNERLTRRLEWEA
jgi:hypothetical protein